MSVMDMIPCIHCGDESHTGTDHVGLFGEPKPSPVSVNGKVSIEDAVKTNEEASDYGAYGSFVLSGTESPFRVLAHDNKRSRAVVSVDSAVATAFVWVGKREQIFATGGAQGFKVLAGRQLEIRNKQELWIVPDGTNASTLAVLNERWE